MSVPKFDYRVERVLNFLRKRWYLLSEERKSQIWSLLLFLNSLRQKVSHSTPSNPNITPIENSKERIKAIMPSSEEWQSVTYKKHPLPVIDVIIPVYKGKEETLRCIYSVLNSNNKTPFELIVINDSSPDKDLVSQIKTLSKTFGFTLVENPTNFGFVKTMNFGMGLHKQRDVIWLNSDTEVFSNWLDRLYEVAYDDDMIATVTPISNNATIFSYPYIQKDNSTNLKCPDEKIDSFCSVYNKGEYCDTPTGVGFCMYVKRSALEKVGMLNEEAFGKGYGEEVDLCQRLIGAKYRNVVTSSVFVRHYGAISFSEKSRLQQEKATQIIDKLYPDYHMQVMDWMSRDPLKISRLKLDVARFKFIEGLKENTILHVLHSRGGGTEKFVENLIKKTKKEGLSALTLRTGVGESALKLEIRNEELYPNLSRLFDIYRDFVSLTEVFQLLNIKTIHVHQLIDVNIDVTLFISAISKFCNIPVVVSIHDYFCCCNSNVINPKSHKLCTFINNRNCCLCDQQLLGIPSWKKVEVYGHLFRCAQKVCVPNEDVAKRLKKVFPQINFQVVPHFDDSMNRGAIVKKWKHDIKVVAVPGAISDIKGSRVVLKLAKHINQCHLPLKIVVVGYTDCDDWLRAENVQITGAYESESELQEKLKEIQADLVFLPFVCPETFSFTCSEALRTGLPIATFDVGAPSQRLKDLGLNEFVLPYDLVEDVSQLSSQLLRLSASNLYYFYNGQEFNLSSYYAFTEKNFNK